jgi:hypothetical protein
MKNYKSEVEGTWVEQTNYFATQEELAAIENAKTEKSKKTLIAKLQEKYTLPVEEAKLEVLNAIYAQFKPVLKDEKDVYQLMTINIFEENGKHKGILTCKVNGEHKQIRF